MKIDIRIMDPIKHAREKMGAGLAFESGGLANGRGGQINWPKGDPTVPLPSPDVISAGDHEEIIVDGRHSVIFIQDTRDSKWTLENKPHESKKYHLFHCSTIDEMKRGGRFERYVVSQRTDGFFRAHTDKGKGEYVDAELQLCLNCMKLADIKMPLEDFVLNDYLAVSNNYIWSKLPLKKEWSRRDWGYPSNWSKISRNIRKQHNWQCEICHVNCSSHPQLLDVHHRNGVKPDVEHRNLQVLCKLCHQEQKFHNHYFVKKEDQNRIRKLREEQSKMWPKAG